MGRRKCGELSMQRRDEDSMLFRYQRWEKIFTVGTEMGLSYLSLIRQLLSLCLHKVINYYVEINCTFQEVAKFCHVGSNEIVKVLASPYRANQNGNDDTDRTTYEDGRQPPAR